MFVAAQSAMNEADVQVQSVSCSWVNHFSLVLLVHPKNLPKANILLTANMVGSPARSRYCTVRSDVTDIHLLGVETAFAFLAEPDGMMNFDQ